ncbi:MAG: MarR family transcriptional regulator, partial [Longimicrobiales bacterium]|nr:MarR family transcriptional regulator [Longimicrobiales bacterium]
DLLHYDVMLHVSEGEAGRRMTDLADVMVMSKSGLTSLVDRMEAEGLLARHPDPTDRRVTRIVLTAEGEKRFAEAARIHGQMVREVFVSHVDPAEAETIVEVLERVRERMGESQQDP